MADQANEVPGIMVGWDEASKDVLVNFDPRLQTLDFVLAVLGMAARKVEAMARLQQAQVMKRQLDEQQQTQKLLSSLKIH